MGTLYVVGTPIGNLEDITLRALRILREVSLIAAEDTRKARRLLDRYEIRTPLTSLFEGNERQKVRAVLHALEGGDVALISEAGMPGIADPGYPLIRAALERGVSVVPVPGPSAHTAALVASGLPTDRFFFAGFLPRRARGRRAALAEVASLRATLIFYEAPHRLAEMLRDIREVLGDRPVALCRELTKVHEEVWRGTVSEAIAHITASPPQGEYTVIVGGATAPPRWEAEAVRQAVRARRAQGLSRSQAAREVAALSGWSRREVYALDDETP